MKSNVNKKIIFLITLGIILGLLSIISYDFNLNVENRDKGLEFNNDIALDNKNLKMLALSGKIHINNNWTDAKKAGICTGAGTYSDPYIIEDLIIDGKGLGSCIVIENSNVYFKIENCTLYNSGYYYPPIFEAGIKLYKTINGQLINNTCHFNQNGIYLYNSYYNIILRNILDYNDDFGIYFSNSNNNNVSKNMINYNPGYGMYLPSSDNNIISGNNISNNGDGLYLSGANNLIFGNNAINNSSYVYGIGIYICGIQNIITGNNLRFNSMGIYIGGTYNTISENSANNNNLYGISVGGSYNNITRNIVSYNSKDGIFLEYNDNGIISNNFVNYNTENGIHLTSSDNNIVSGNDLEGNFKCILEEKCIGNKFEDNSYCDYGESNIDLLIPGYNIFFLFGILSIIIIIISKKLRKFLN